MPTSSRSTLELTLERRDGITRPVRAFAQPPLQLSRARYDAALRPAQASFTLLHLGGILAGDQNQIIVDLGAAAAAQVIGAGATQVYCMPTGEASQHTLLNLASESRLAWLAAPLILFGGAHFTQTVQVTLAAGAQLVYLDVWVPGRLARGEAFAFARYHSRFEVYDKTGSLLVAEYAVLEPQRHSLAVLGMFADTPVVGSLYILGARDPARIEAQVRSADIRLATAELPNNCGVLVRAVGQAAHMVHQRLLNIWQVVQADYQATH